MDVASNRDDMGDGNVKMNPVVHFELPAADSKRMAGFYARAFGWQTKQLGPEMGNYVVVTTTELGANQLPKEPGRINGGFFTKTKVSSPKGRSSSSGVDPEHGACLG